MEDENKNENVLIKESEKITRRDFLKQGAIASAALASIALSNNTDFSNKEETDLFSPRIINDVEVYGIDQNLDSEEKVLQLYESIDRKCEKKYGIKINDKWEQKREFLNPQERYLEVVILKSAYEQFLQKAERTGEDFVQWIKMHVDTLNICLRNASPSNNVTVFLNRIIVVDDKMPMNFYDKQQKDYLGGALDYKWASHFFGKLPFDTDCSWAISDDNRPEQEDSLYHNYYWGFKNHPEKLVFGWPPGANEYKFTYEYPQQNDLLKNKQNKWVDIGLIHEWSHYLLNLPDEYNFDISDEKHRFKNFYLRNGYYWGSFHEPKLSPYLSSFLKKNSEQKKRYWFSMVEALNFENRPEKIGIDFEDKDIQQLEIRRVRLDGDSIEYSTKSYPSTPDLVVNSNKFLLDDSLFKDNSHSWLIKADFKNGKTRELNLPIACFQMSESASVEDATYKIEFSGYDDVEQETQVGMIVNEAEVSKWIEENERRGIKYYAKMKIDGTDSLFIWFISKSIEQ